MELYFDGLVGSENKNGEEVEKAIVIFVKKKKLPLSVRLESTRDLPTKKMIVKSPRIKSTILHFQTENSGFNPRHFLQNS